MRLAELSSLKWDGDTPQISNLKTHFPSQKHSQKRFSSDEKFINLLGKSEKRRREGSWRENAPQRRDPFAPVGIFAASLNIQLSFRVHTTVIFMYAEHAQKREREKVDSKAS